MNWKWFQSNRGFLPIGLRFLVVVLIILGVFFRFVNLDQKVYWGDEVNSAIRMAGYTKAEVHQQIFNGEVVSLEEIQTYQYPSSETTLSDTLNSLVTESPEHLPLYFVLGRVWEQIFGKSLLIRRSLPVLLNLLAIPAMYWLSLELFKSPVTAWIATGLFAVSPLQILYAQEVREYSLWILTTLLSCAALIWALRRDRTFAWVVYSITLALTLNSFLFSLFVAIAQGIYVFYCQGLRFSKTVRAYLLATLAASLTFLPWGMAIALNLAKVHESTDWTGDEAENLYVVKLWGLNLVSNFIDLRYNHDDPFGIQFSLNRPFTYLTFIILAIVGYSIYWLCRKTPPRIWTFILILLGVTVFPLLLPDLILGGQRTSIARYLFPCYLAIQLAVAHLFASKITEIEIKPQQKLFWKAVMVIVLSGGVVSGAMIASSQTWWTKYADYFNPEIARVINQSSQPLVIGDIGLNTSRNRLLSLSYLLDPKVKIQGLVPANAAQLSPDFSDIFLISARRYESLPTILEKEYKYRLELAYEADLSYKRRKIRLWKLIKP